MYGSLNVEQAQAVQRLVRGKVVHDLGAGDLGLARELVQLGANQVIAVDQCFGWNGTVAPQLERRGCRFSEFTDPIDIAFVSWPEVPEAMTGGLERLVGLAALVIYLGANTDGTACGSEAFWSQLVQREVLVHLPDRPNTLIAYGRERARRRYLPEEYAASERTTWLSYTELHERAGFPFPKLPPPP